MQRQLMLQIWNRIKKYREARDTRIRYGKARSRGSRGAQVGAGKVRGAALFLLFALRFHASGDASLSSFKRLCAFQVRLVPRRLSHSIVFVRQPRGTDTEHFPPACLEYLALV